MAQLDFKARVPVERVALVGAAANLAVKVLGFSRTVIVAALVGASLRLDVLFGLQVVIGLISVTFADQFEIAVGQRVRVLGSEGDYDERNSAALIALSFVISVAQTIVFGVAVFTIYGLLFERSASHAVTLLQRATLSSLLIPAVSFYLPARVCCGLLKGQGRYSESFAVDVSQSLVFFVAATGLMMLFPGEAGPVLALASAQSLAAVWNFVHAASRLDKSVWRTPLKLDEVLQSLGGASKGVIHLYFAGLLSFAFTLIDRAVAAFTPGGLAVLTFASQLSLTMRSVVSVEQVFGVELGRIATSPEMARRALRAALSGALVVTVVSLTLSREIVAVVFERGRFTHQMSVATARALFVYGAGSVAFVLWPIVLRGMQAIHRTRSVPYLLGAAVSVSALAGPVLGRRFGPAGAVMGTMCGYIILLTGGIWILRSHRIAVLTPSDVLEFASAFIIACTLIAMVKASVGSGSPVLSIGAGGLIALAAAAFTWDRTRRMAFA